MLPGLPVGGGGPPDPSRGGLPPWARRRPARRRVAPRSGVRLSRAEQRSWNSPPVWRTPGPES
eukprot:1854257-Alexandrium_andersonii.AAC.1